MEDIKEARKKTQLKNHHDNYFCPLILQIFEVYHQYIKSNQGKLEIYVH